MNGGEAFMHHMKHFFKDLDHTLENKGDELVITIKGDREKLEKLEKKLKAIHELCSDEDCCKGEGCC